MNKVFNFLFAIKKYCCTFVQATTNHIKSSVMKTFNDVKIGQTFYTSNGKPSKKISNTMAVSLVPEYCGVDFQESKDNVTFSQNQSDHVYGIK